MARQILRHSGARPGPGWHKHGFTRRVLPVLDDGQQRQVELRKQRWLEVATGRTRHDRPLWELAWARSPLDIVFLTLSAWLLSDRGLHHATWPWEPERPSRRTAQRWLKRLRPNALCWQHAIRLAVIDRLAPRPLEEFLPTGGIPPPEGRQRRLHAEVLRLSRGLWLLEKAAQELLIPVNTLLVEARRRLTPTMPTNA